MHSKKFASKLSASLGEKCNFFRLPFYRCIGLYLISGGSYPIDKAQDCAEQYKLFCRKDDIIIDMWDVQTGQGFRESLVVLLQEKNIR